VDLFIDAAGGRGLSEQIRGPLRPAEVRYDLRAGLADPRLFPAGGGCYLVWSFRVNLDLDASPSRR